MTKAQLVADIAALDESIARIKDLGASYVNQYDPTLMAAECIAALEGMRDAKVRRLNDYDHPSVYIVCQNTLGRPRDDAASLDGGRPLGVVPDFPRYVECQNTIPGHDD